MFVLRSLKFSNLYITMDHQTLMVNERIRRVKMRKALQEAWERFLILLGAGLFQADQETLDAIHKEFDNEENINQRYFHLPRCIYTARIITDYPGNTTDEKINAFVEEMLHDINKNKTENDAQLDAGLTQATILTLTNKMVYLTQIYPSL